MPTEEELEQMVSEQIDRELFTDDEKFMIREMLTKDMGASRIKRLAEKTAKGGSLK